MTENIPDPRIKALQEDAHTLEQAQFMWAEFVKFVAGMEGEGENFKFKCTYFQKLDKLLGDGKHV